MFRQIHDRWRGQVSPSPSLHGLSRHRSRRPKRGPVPATARADHIAAASATRSDRSCRYRPDRIPVALVANLLADPRTQRCTRTRSLGLPLAFDGGRFLDISLCQCRNRGGDEHCECGRGGGEYQGLHDFSPRTEGAVGKLAPRGWAAYGRPALGRVRLASCQAKVSGGCCSGGADRPCSAG
jgi:hypothetical protein